MILTPTVATKERFQLDFFIERESWESLFDRIEVWRSRLTEAGPYEPLTDDSWSPARLPLGVVGDPPASPQTGPSAYLVGKTLEFLVGETVPVTVTFAGSDPLTFGQAAFQTNTQGQGLLFCFVLGSALVVQTTQPGAGAVLRLVGGDAAPVLKLYHGIHHGLAFGRDARPALVLGEQKYSFVDPNGLAKYWYKARFFNSASRLTSAYSAPFQGAPLRGIDACHLVRGHVDLVDLFGEPINNQEVLVYNAFNGTQVAGKTVVGGSRRQFTDRSGRAEFLLVRGTTVVVAIGGTTLARDVLVPTDPAIESIALLDPGVGTNDVFSVQVPNLEYAERRHL